MATSFLVLSFLAGVISFFAPCSVAMLPAYVAYFLGQRPDASPGTTAPHGPWRAAVHGLGPLVASLGLAILMLAWHEIQEAQAGFARLDATQVVLTLVGMAIVAAGVLAATGGSRFLLGLKFGLVTTAAILFVFVAIGILLTLLVGGLDSRMLIWAGIGVGSVLVLMGILGLAGRDVAFTLPVKAPRQRTLVGFFLFGLAYGVVSLGCNFPLFIVPLGHALDEAGTPGALASFFAYGAGAGLLMIVVSVSVATSRGLTAQRVRRLVPIMRRATHVVLVLAGLFVIAFFQEVLTGVQVLPDWATAWP